MLNLNIIREMLAQRRALDPLSPRRVSIAASIAMVVPDLLLLIEDAARQFDADGYQDAAAKLRAGRRLYTEGA